MDADNLQGGGGKGGGGRGRGSTEDADGFAADCDGNIDQILPA